MNGTQKVTPVTAISNAIWIMTIYLAIISPDKPVSSFDPHLKYKYDPIDIGIYPSRTRMINKLKNNCY